MAIGSLSGGALVRAILCGAIAVAVVAGLTVVAGVLPADAPVFVAAGAGAAALAGGLAVLFHGRFLDRRATAHLRNDGPLLAGRLQSLLAAAFGLKLLVLVIGVLTLRGLGVKFEQLAAFAIAFAAASLLCQIVAAGYLVRALSRCGVSRDLAVCSGAPERSGVPAKSPE